MKNLKLENSVGGNDYQINPLRQRSLKTKFDKISDSSFYRESLIIAVDEYVKFLNISPEKMVINTNGGKSFAIKTDDGVFVKNKKLLNQSIKKSLKGTFRTFSWMEFNVVLDKLEENLSSRFN